MEDKERRIAQEKIRAAGFLGAKINEEFVKIDGSYFNKVTTTAIPKQAFLFPIDKEEAIEEISSNISNVEENKERMIEKKTELENLK